MLLRDQLRGWYMKKLRYFKCSESSELIERLVEDDMRVIECECGGLASRQLSAPRSFGNTTGKSPSSGYARPR